MIGTWEGGCNYSIFVCLKISVSEWKKNYGKILSNIKSTLLWRVNITVNKNKNKIHWSLTEFTKFLWFTNLLPGCNAYDSSQKF